MGDNMQHEINRSLNRVGALFMPGFLANKRNDMIRLRENGDTMFFEGEVSWHVQLPDHDKQLSGQSPSLDAALGDMTACLDMLADAHEENSTQVICSIETHSSDMETKP